MCKFADYGYFPTHRSRGDIRGSPGIVVPLPGSRTLAAKSSGLRLSGLRESHRRVAGGAATSTRKESLGLPRPPAEQLLACATGEGGTRIPASANCVLSHECQASPILARARGPQCWPLDKPPVYKRSFTQSWSPGMYGPTSVLPAIPSVGRAVSLKVGSLEIIFTRLHLPSSFKPRSSSKLSAWRDGLVRHAF